MKPNETDHFKAAASADLSDKPPGVSILDWITDKGERDSNRKRTVSAAIRAKIALHEAKASAKTAKAVSTQATAAVRALPPAPISLHQQYRNLMRQSPAAAGKFWAKNADQIKAELAPPTFKNSN